jgi:hypothetical protein
MDELSEELYEDEGMLNSAVYYRSSTVRVFGQKFTLEDAIELHAFAPLETLPGV